jgi:hypothetical protein
VEGCGYEKDCTNVEGIAVAFYYCLSQLDLQLIASDDERLEFAQSAAQTAPDIP